MNTPYFSIITCTLNSDKFLLRNLDSVKNQSLHNYEHIFIDGGSTDDTKRILNVYKKDRVNRASITTSLKRGVSLAFNKGIKMSRGKYLIFLNSDDYFYDYNVLRDSYNFLTKYNHLDWIYGKINVIEEDGKPVGIFPTKKIFQISNNFILKFISFIPHQAVFMKKEVFNKYGGFDTSLKVNMDTDLWLRIGPKTKWVFFDRNISNYTLRSDSLTSGIKNKKIGFETLEKVKLRYLSWPEKFLAKIVDYLIFKHNKIYR